MKVLTNEGNQLLEKTLKATATGSTLYKNQYCEKPEIKETGNGYIEYWNKDKSAYTRLEIGTENSNWKFSGITIYVISTPEKARIIESTPCNTRTSNAQNPVTNNKLQIPKSLNGILKKQ